MNNITTLTLQIISTIPVDILMISCWQQCFNDIKISKKKITILAVFITLATAILNYNLPKEIRMFIMFSFFILVNYIFISKNFYKAIISVLILEVIAWIIEFSFFIGASIIFSKKVYTFLNSIGGFITLNLYITFILFIALKRKIPNRIYEKLNGIWKSITTNETVLYLIIIMLIIIISTIESYVNLPTQAILITNTIMAIIFIIIILKFTSIKANYNKINNQYQTSISSLKEYEEMIDKYRVNNHENKNELMTIRNMIKTKDKGMVEYIDKLVDNKIKDNERIMYKTSKIPEGGLRAIIYSKLNLMDKYKIKYTLDIANDVRTVDLINIDEELMLNICKIIGVFLDNSIDAVKKLRKKNITIEFYVMDNYLNIDITNNFKGNLDISKLGKKYTTKGKGHGYGLSLVEQIISENSKKLENEKSINGDKFTQRLKIKM